MVVPSPSRHPFLALVNNASKGYRKGDRQCILIIQWKPRATTTRKQAPSSQKQPPIQNTGKRTALVHSAVDQSFKFFEPNRPPPPHLNGHLKFARNCLSSAIPVRRFSIRRGVHDFPMQQRLF